MILGIPLVCPDIPSVRFSTYHTEQESIHRYGPNLQSLIKNLMKMLLFIIVIEKNIIKVNNNKFFNNMFENMIHKAHKCTRSFRETKWHYYLFIQTISCFECYFSFIFKSISNRLNDSHCEVNLEEYKCPMKLVKKIIQTTNRKAIINTNLIYICFQSKMK